jgi:hypothetical protein
MKAPNGQPTKLNEMQWLQVRTPNFKAWFGDWESSIAANVLNGDPVASVSKKDVPNGGISSVRDWAMKIFEQQGGKAVNSILGEVGLTDKSVRDSIEHSHSKFKFAAFPAIKSVIENGALIDSRRLSGVGHFYISAPVTVDGKADIVTVLIKKDPNSQRMYIHSVTSKERLLATPTSREPQAKNQSYAEVKASSADIHNILHNHLTHNPNSVSKVIDENGEPMVMQGRIILCLLT